ncbi:SprT-like domain-containing protein [Nitrospira sp. NS4]|uniref:SprT-like domain-containing protein n=1 Tax=Nitrospira sp. NS4 TaxID=3414498 RepID=UPI003C2B0125
MTTPSPERPQPDSIKWSPDRLQAEWDTLNERYFSGLLPAIAIVWSRRLTSSAGMFVSRGGPRPRVANLISPHRIRREIRLSEPLLTQLAERTPHAEQELLNTLAHEMIHQWQFDVLKRKPNHGPDFLRKMTEMNRSGLVSITTYHSLQKEVLALARFAWRCTGCGRVYRRQRKTIEPRRHVCGSCRGPLQELPRRQPAAAAPPAPVEPDILPACSTPHPAAQLALNWDAVTGSDSLVP